ncbi:MAG: MBL fold metallo-hydrolase [Candidatus Lokiarchaeota archaeon]|nr:MBL fold metallo-hydrolase [Candidatus Lokiarchaeota archaeon]
MEIKWISHACFQITAGSDVVYTDPYEVPAGMPRATVILVSHDHYDHAEERSIASVKADSTVVVCPKTCTGKLAKLEPRGMDPGEEIDIGGMKISAVPAYTFPGKPFHPKANKWNGYVVEIQGKKLYHAGDCDIMDDMKDLAAMAIDVAMLPVGNKGFTMDFADAAKAVGYIKPKIMVPMHDWDQDLAPLAAMVAKEAPGVKVEVLKGRSLTL